MRSMLLWIVAMTAGCSSASTPPPSNPPPVGSGSSDVHCPDPRPAPDAVCLQDCGPPVSREGDPEPGWRWVSAADAANRQKFGCPICLPPDAMIATPSGDVPLSSLAAGTLVWSTDEAGQRIAVPVVHVGSTPAPRDHVLVVVELSDGRTVRASAGHPTADGRTLGTLVVGAALDGVRVTAIHPQPFGGARTYDLLPASATRTYWADGVLLTSTLHAPKP